MKTHYEVLGVQPNADLEEITKAFRKMSLRWHPDKNIENVAEATAKFKLIGEAYYVLKDPERRQEYDEEIKQKKQNENVSRPHGKQHRKQNQRSNSNGEEKEQEEKVPESRRQEMNIKEVEALMKLAATLLEEHLKEQQRQKDLGKQLVNAIKEKNYNALPNLIQQGAFLDELSNEGYAGIHYAVLNDNSHLLAYLIAAGANVNIKSNIGNTALHICVMENNFDLAKKLIKTHKAETYHQNNNEDTPLHYAIKNKCDQRIQNLLIKRYSKYIGFFSSYSALDYQDSFKNTPLHLALETRQFESVGLLLFKDARIDLKNNRNQTAIDLMRKIYHELPVALSTWLDQTLLIQERARKNSSCLVM